VHALGGGIGQGLAMAIGAAIGAAETARAEDLGPGRRRRLHPEPGRATAVQERADTMIVLMNDSATA
jgi:acetolactate synthase-1/2/3 large subunit